MVFLILHINVISNKIKTLYCHAKNNLFQNIFFLHLKFTLLKIISVIWGKWNQTFLVQSSHCMTMGKTAQQPK